MKLHRSQNQPDWALLDPDSRNAWQTLAARTNGVVTPGNLFTIVGFLTVLAGLGIIINHDYGWGTVVVALGRLCDIADGWVAEQTGTKSPLGEKLDASLDKLVTGVALITLMIVQVMPVIVVVALLIPHVVITLVSATALRHSSLLHPSKYGKLSMATAWLTVLLFILSAARFGRAHDTTLTLGYVLFAMSLCLGLFAAFDYCRQYFGRRA